MKFVSYLVGLVRHLMGLVGRLMGFLGDLMRFMAGDVGLMSCSMLLVGGAMMLVGGRTGLMCTFVSRCRESMGRLMGLVGAYFVTRFQKFPDHMSCSSRFLTCPWSSVSFVRLRRRFGSCYLISTHRVRMNSTGWLL